MTPYRYVIGKQLYIGHLFNPFMAVHVSSAATKGSNLRLIYIGALQTTLKTIKNYALTGTYLPSVGKAFNPETVSYASMRESQSKPNVREGILVFRRCAESLHIISWTSQFARRVARSTSTADLLATAHAVYKITYFRYLLEEVTNAQKT